LCSVQTTKDSALSHKVQITQEWMKIFTT